MEDRSYKIVTKIVDRVQPSWRAAWHSLDTTVDIGKGDTEEEAVQDLLTQYGLPNTQGAM